MKNLLRLAKAHLYRIAARWSMDWAERLAPVPDIRTLQSIDRPDTPPTPDPDASTIILFANRSWRIHKALEGVLGRALRERGNVVEALYGDDLPHSESYEDVLDGRARRAQAAATANYIRSVFFHFGVPSTPLSDWVRADDQQALDEAMAAHDGPWRGFSFRGHPLGEWSMTSVAWRLTGETIDETDPATRLLYRKVVKTAGHVLLGADAYLDARQPDCVVVMNGIFAPERVMFERARARGLRVVTHEHGHHQNSFVFAHNKPSNYFNYDAEWNVRQAEPLTDSERERIVSYLRDRSGAQVEGGAVNYWPDVADDQAVIEDRLGTSFDRDTLVLFPNIVWDSAALQRDVAFDGLMDWVLETIDAVAELPDKQLIVRAHPAEVRLGRQTSERVGERIREAFPTLPDNVFVVPPESDISSYVLMEVAEAVLVYTSTTGLEAVLHGYPTVVAGETHYRGKGWTVDVDGREQYRTLLAQDLTQHAPTPSDVEEALRYAHLFFFEGHLDLPVFERSRDEGETVYHIDDLRELRPGVFDALDRLCTAVEEGRSFVYPGQCDAEARKPLDQGVFRTAASPPENAVATDA